VEGGSKPKRQIDPLLRRRVANEVDTRVRIPPSAQEEAIAAVVDDTAPVCGRQERKRGVDHGRASTRQVNEVAAVATIGAQAVKEEAGHGLRAPAADDGVGAEGKPWPGDALEAAQRLVGHPREDFGDEIVGEAGRHWLLHHLHLVAAAEVVQGRTALKRSR
jgi:hypothetical protein